MKSKNISFILAGLFFSSILFSCQTPVQPMDPAAQKTAVKEQFVKRSMGLIDSMTAVCDKRVADATK